MPPKRNQKRPVVEEPKEKKTRKQELGYVVTALHPNIVYRVIDRPDTQRKIITVRRTQHCVHCGNFIEKGDKSFVERRQYHDLGRPRYVSDYHCGDCYEEVPEPEDDRSKEIEFSPYVGDELP